MHFPLERITLEVPMRMLGKIIYLRAKSSPPVGGLRHWSRKALTYFLGKHLFRFFMIFGEILLSSVGFPGLFLSFSLVFFFCTSTGLLGLYFSCILSSSLRLNEPCFSDLKLFFLHFGTENEFVKLL